MKSEATKLVRSYYADYAKYVNDTRALPTIYDGLKAVQRRLIYAAYTMPDKLTVSATIVGEAMGKYHPHGDSSCYGALVTMTWPGCPFKLFDGHGNFGDRHYAAAAMRYTKARLNDLARFIYCQFIDYADYSEGEADYEEPKYLPSLLPYSLLASSSGIGIGLSTNFLSINPIDLCDYYLARLRNTKTPYLRPNIGEGVIEDSVSNVHHQILQGNGGFYVSPVIVEESGDRIVVKSMPPNSYIDRVIKKVKSYIDSGQVDYIDESSEDERYVFHIVSNKVDKAAFKEEIIKASKVYRSFDFVCSNEDGAVYSDLDYIVSNSLEYLIKCVKRKFDSDYNKSAKQLRILNAIEMLKSSGRVGEITKTDKIQFRALMKEICGCDDATSDEVMKKPISYLTRSHLDEIEKLKNEVETSGKYKDDPTEYLVSLYNELKIMLSTTFKYKTIFRDNDIPEDAQFSIPKSEVIKYLVNKNDGTVIQYKGDGSSSSDYIPIDNDGPNIIMITNKYGVIAYNLASAVNGKYSVVLGNDESISDARGVGDKVKVFGEKYGYEYDIKVSGYLKSRSSKPYYPGDKISRFGD